jgi:hypothetical protein
MEFSGEKFQKIPNKFQKFKKNLKIPKKSKNSISIP